MATGRAPIMRHTGPLPDQGEDIVEAGVGDSFWATKRRLTMSIESDIKRLKLRESLFQPAEYNKPCPICGGPVRLDKDDPFMYLYCVMCGARKVVQVRDYYPMPKIDRIPQVARCRPQEKWESMKCKDGYSWAYRFVRAAQEYVSVTGTKILKGSLYEFRKRTATVRPGETETATQRWHLDESEIWAAKNKKA